MPEDRLDALLEDMHKWIIGIPKKEKSFFRKIEYYFWNICAALLFVK